MKSLPETVFHPISFYFHKTTKNTIKLFWLFGDGGRITRYESKSKVYNKG